MYNSKTKSLKEKQMPLFTFEGPLAHRIRPKSVDEIIGQEHLLSENGVLTKWFEHDLPYSIILWGPPGIGKTTIAHVAQYNTKKDFIYLSGAATSVSEIRDILKEAHVRPGNIVLFVDEIHRLAKNQQDVFLESLESGVLALIGSTTENPHISITRALHSRVQVLELKPLNENNLEKLIKNALSHPNGKLNSHINDVAIKLLVNSSGGDSRRLLFNLEEASKRANNFNDSLIDEKVVQVILKDSQLQIGADPENHYNCISALQKSIRGSNPDAALYWLARLLAGGADPVHVARRVLVTASEDIGLADNNALAVAVNAYQAAQFLGMPEARIPLAQAVIYLSSANKSNTTIVSIDKAMKDARELTQYPVPIHIRNVGGEGYKYPPAYEASEARPTHEVSGRHAYKDAKVEQEYLPEELKGKKYFVSGEKKSFNSF